MCIGASMTNEELAEAIKVALGMMRLHCAFTEAYKTAHDHFKALLAVQLERAAASNNEAQSE